MTLPNDTAERWLKCRVEKGMFSDERVVTYPYEGGAVTSAFVPEQTVRISHGNIGKVRVRVSHHGGTTIAVIPSDYGDPVAVSELDLSDTE